MAEPWLELEMVVRGAATRLAFSASAPFVGVSGPSGAGKSTLLRVLAGVERRFEGRVTAFGERWSGPDAVSPWARGLGWAPQDAVLFPHLTVRDNLGYAGRGVDPEVVGWLGLAALLDRAPRNLSGGERQRVALGRALCAQPRLLLLDEPFAALDPELRGSVGRATASWCRNHGVRVVLVSHDADDLHAFDADRWSLGEATSGGVVASFADHERP
jgi:ABC-type sulfate/molybdate transport systems ATPase subunit